MVSRTFTIRNQAGLHLKPSAALCTEAIKYKSSVTLTFGNTTTNAKSVLNVLSAGIELFRTLEQRLGLNCFYRNGGMGK